MIFTERRVIQKIVALLLVMIMTFADFSIVGANLISYALDMVQTNSDNVEFSAYFINKPEEKMSSIESSINAERLKMYVEISVKNEGYFNGKITLGDSSFNFVDNVSSEYVKQIKDNTVTLSQINAGETVVVELEIEYAYSKEIKKLSLNQESEINLTGIYVKSKKSDVDDIEIKGTTKVKINWKSPEDIKTNLDTKILTNSIYKVNDVNKRIVQVLIDSKLNNNSYPVKETEIQLNVPNGAEEVKVHSRSTNATNGNMEFGEKNYRYDEENGVLDINIQNAEKDGQINWNKDVKDTLIVTYVYPEAENLIDVKINTDAKVITYDDLTVEAERSQLVISEDTEGIVSNEVLEKETEIYKGKIYTGEERKYNSTTILNIDYVGIVKEIVMTEDEPIFKTEDEEQKVNMEYVETEINKAKFVELFSENGYIKILDKKENILQTIDKDTLTDDKGDVIVKYPDNINEIVIKTSEPKLNGTLNIEHTKIILDNKLSRVEVEDLEEIQERVNINCIKNDENDFESSVTNTIKLKETEMKSKININKETLTTESKNEDIIIQTTLLTNGEDKALYKNPIIRIKLPKEIVKLENVKTKVVNGNGLVLDNASVTTEDDLKIITIKLKGEQKEYTQEVIEGTLIQLRLDCIINELTTDKEEKIKLEVINENISEKMHNDTLVNIINPKSMIIFNDIVGYEDNIKLDTNKEEKEFKAKLQIINNEEASISDVRILGDLPTNSTKNNMGLLLEKKMSANLDNVKIYYTNNENATADINADDNKWQKELPKEVRKYLILVEKLDKSEELIVDYEIIVPENLEYGLYSESGYQVKYLDDASSKERIIESTKYSFSTGEKTKIEQKVTASVGGVLLEDGKEVNSGDIIKYEITLENKGNTDINNVKVEGTVPEGTTRVILTEVIDEDAVMSEESVTYMDYVENADRSVIFDNINIKPGEKINLEYEVRVNNDISDKVNTTCKITTIYNDSKEESIINHILKHVKISLNLIAKARKIGKVKSGYNYDYVLKIQNNDNKDIENLRVNINNNEMLKIVSVYYNSADSFIYNNENVSNEFVIDKVKAGEIKEVLISTIVQKKTDTIGNTEISVNVIDNNNVVYRSNLIKEDIETVKVNLKIESITDSEEKNNYVTSGDVIKYIITAENIGDIDADILIIKDKVINYLTIQKVKLNDKDIKYDETISFEDGKSYTTLSINKPLKSGEKCTLEIDTSVNEIKSVDILEITNNAYLYNNINLAEAKGQTYYIKNVVTNNTVEPEDTENKDNENAQMPDNTDKTKKDKYVLSGKVWFDDNKDGKRDEDEVAIEAINLSLINSNGKCITTGTTNQEGMYSFTDIEKGKYNIIFEYDTRLYIPTIYQAEGVEKDKNSDAVQSKLKIKDEYKTVAITDSINLSEDLSNIDLGLIKAEKFDFELNKYVSRISVINSNETKSYEFDKEQLAKVEIDAKKLKASDVIIEYIIEIKNTGEVSGYIPNIVDYKPTSLKFSSNLNKDWYQSGKYLYNDSLSNVEIRAGETKEIKLILSKEMTESNTGLINNTAEIVKAYNAKGFADIDSIPGNNLREEDDFGTADVIISIKTGVVVSYVFATFIVMLGIVIVAYFVNKKFLKRYINR